ncbi:class I SAM-dependent methyltransferase [Amycolatopsis australiensis]|uniref:Methyltransferase domain-containing protein n=1 Tax=Amycolatopsis australiensis TaxID=546364 RepID=A0A1K1T7U5_9PSEU|nr:class I SAM-dependent methyltransferase [Amycolatopsis australiensis]SFW42406.1 Methyltransferase domain-containing protein [Amycolatopsis australiensis]SFW92648.1 Methyltransferase domain-containing protein [Amycolatopsis australiensis]
MRDALRRYLRADRLRHSLRDKVSRAVEEAVGRHFAEQSAKLDALSREVAELRQQLPGETRGQADRVVEHLSHFEHRARRDLMFAGEAEAAQRSAEFVRDHMKTARPFPTPHSTLEHALTLAPQGGLALEFGVYSGTTLKIIANARGGESVYGFDSFEGLPETWRSGYPAGTFDMESLPDVPGAELVVGWFDDVLPGFLEAHPGPVDFLHVDCDLYSSTKTVLELVGPRLRPGSIVVFDEYFNYSGWQEHEHRAWLEHVEAARLRFEYEAYTVDHEQVAVKVLG